MSDEIQRLEDGTLGFLPERLNRDPTVLRGLTSDEMWVALAVGAGCGLLLGIPLALVTSALAMLPTSMIASMALSLLAGGSLLRRAKRARPETWLYRRLQWSLARYGAIGRSGLLLHSGAWTVRRTRRHQPHGRLHP